MEKLRKEGNAGCALHYGDCLHVMPTFCSESVDLVLTDLPYGVSRNKWDNVLPLDRLWDNINRVLKPNGAAVFTSTQPFTSVLIASNPADFRYEWIWEKSCGSCQFNIRHQPLRVHESVLVFYRQKPVYNEIKIADGGKPYQLWRKGITGQNGYGKQSDSEKTSNGDRHARSVLKIPNPRVRGGHPTQKPEALMEYFIATYTNKEGVVLDCCMGSGTTGVAAANLGRYFIGIEMDEMYFEMAKNRILSNGW
ncbi:DNA-methyltransferase [Geobacter grbiciae]|uniref:DNA-methyltransferase n=1 Tax=Geobacter grbiciae TaxID=155042 RepID=UPI001C0316A7|nr:site-specific DNA-methyltransferase [Geobacter grbiciae]MBT1073966.1 hypothetical protein [Geobacter grbiciae]